MYLILRISQCFLRLTSLALRPFLLITSFIISVLKHMSDINVIDTYIYLFLLR